MATPEPEDARPAPVLSDKARAHQERLAQTQRDLFRTRGRSVGVRISDDMTEVWSHGIGQPHYPMAGARAEVRELGAYIVFTAPTYELAIRVPKGSQKRAQKWVSEFNTYQMNGRLPI